jgi:hypothetical protein
VVILGVKAVTAEMTLELSAALKAVEPETAVVVVVMSFARLLSAVARGIAWKMEPVNEETSLERVSMSRRRWKCLRERWRLGAC